MLALAASAAMWAAVVVAWAVERGLFDVPLRKWSGLPFVRKVLFAMASAAVVAWGAPKPPSGAPMRMAPAPVVEPVAVDAVAFALPTNLPPVTNLCFWGIERGPNSVALGLAWPSSLSLTNGCIDLFGHWHLATNGWAHLAQIDVGGAQSNAVVELPFADFPTNAMASTAFFRAADQADTDGDGLSDAFERLVSGSSPTDPDTDGDGIADGDEVSFGSDPNCEDSDHDDVPDREELGSIELMAPADTFWQRMSDGRSVWSNTLNAGTGGSDIDLPCPFRVNGVTYTRLLVGVDGVLYLMSPERPEFWWRDVILDPPDLGVTALTGGYVAIAGFCADLHVKARDWGTRVAYGTASLPSGPATVVDFYNFGFESDVASSDYYLFSYQLVLPQNEPNVFYLTYNPMYPAAHFAAQNPTIGVQFPELAPLRADEDYYNLTWRYAEEFFTAMRRLKFTIGRGTDPASDDTDGDGFKDYEETALFQTDPTVPDDDSDLDGLPDALEFRLGTDPDLDDTDHDGVSDLDEFLEGTDPLQPDTDGDGMNDGWERAYDGTEVRRLDPDGVTVNPVPGWTVPFDPGIDNRMDANSHNDPSADPDNDGLSNAEECAMGTNPCHPDTDGDGVPDPIEKGQGSDPNDASDGGVPGSRAPVSFTFGDHSGSHSEKYTLSVTPVSGSGSRPSSFRWLNENYGVCETKTAYLKPGWRYAVRLDHSGTKEGLPTDYDYTLRQTGTLPSNVVITDDQSLFGVDNTSSSFAGAGKVAYVDVLKFEFMTPAGDPVSSPNATAGVGQNEFTYDDGTSSLSVLLQVVVQPTLVDDVVLQGVFAISNIEGATLGWAAENPGGSVTSNTDEGFDGVSRSVFTAHATFRRYPSHNSGFGRKSAVFTSCGVTITNDFEVFFPKFGTNHPTCSTCPNCSNWFYYWREGGVCSIPEDVRWASATGTHAGHRGWSNDDGIFITDLAAGEPSEYPKQLSASFTVTNYVFEVWKESGSSTFLGIDVKPTSQGEPGYRYYVSNRVVGVTHAKETIRMEINGRGIRRVASTVSHEQCHKLIAQNFQAHAQQLKPYPDVDQLIEDYGFDSKEYAESLCAYEESQYLHGDYDERWGDGVYDVGERNGYLSVSSDVNKRDTFNIAGEYGTDYRRYGDEEARCREAEWNNLESKYHVELDWSDPGCQHKDPYGPFLEGE